MGNKENKSTEKKKTSLAMKPENENNFRKVGVPLIKVVDSMEKLRKLDMLELPWLADDIRHEIIKVISKNGGHLGPSLGVVDLTIALHYVFNTPDDKLIWDVGHQCYAHKILTGRYKEFRTIRKEGGLSGFTKRSESEFDPFGAGHSSTSISAGLGMATARDIKGEKRNVIAVIGDGSMSAGMAFEAMNNAGDMNSKLIVILNDNDMSISPPVGALSKYLEDITAYFSKVITSKPFMSFRKTAFNLAEKLPEPIAKFARRTETHAKGLMTGGTWFEELGFYYVGPIDGHSFDDMIPVFQNVRDSDEHRAFLIHVKTKKGYGYKPAEQLPTKFHGVSKFNIETGEFSPSLSLIPSCTQGFSLVINKLAKEDKDVAAITAAMPSGTGLDAFALDFPKQFFDVGIAEQHAVTFAAGLAAGGVKPFVCLYSSFFQRAYDQVLHDVVLQGLPVRFMLDRAGFVGEDGITHHGLYDISLTMNLHGVVVMVPSSYAEVLNMVRTAYSIDDRPSFVRYPRGCLPYMEETAGDFGEVLEIGKARVLKEAADGKKDVAIISLGSRLNDALQAAEMMSEKGVGVTVVDARFAKPFDKELFLELASSYSVVITVEEGAAGGFGSAVSDFLAKEGILDGGKVKFRALAINDDFYNHAPIPQQLKYAGLDAGGIYESVMLLLGKSSSSKVRSVS